MAIFKCEGCKKSESFCENVCSELDGWTCDICEDDFQAHENDVPSIGDKVFCSEECYEKGVYKYKLGENMNKESMFNEIYKDSLREGFFKDAAASIAQELPFDKPKQWAKKHWKSAYPEEYAKFEADKKEKDRLEREAKEAEYAALELKRRDEYETKYPGKKEERLRDEKIKEFLKSGTWDGYLGYNKPNDWKAYLDDHWKDLKDEFNLSSEKAVKSAFVRFMKETGQISSQIHATAWKAIANKEPLYKGKKRVKINDYLTGEEPTTLSESFASIYRRSNG